MESRFSIVPRSRSRVMARPVIMTIVIVSIDAHQAGHDVVLRDRLPGCRARGPADRSGRRCALSDASGPLRSFCKRCDRAACSSEPSALPVAAGSVASASTSIAGRSPRSRSRLKFCGMLIDELHLAAREQLAALRFGLHLPDEVEVAAVLHRGEQRASLRALSARSTAAGRCLGSELIAKPKSSQLNQRDAEHHGEGQPVAPHLDEFLHDDAPRAAANENVMVSFHARKLSCRLFHQVDEHILQARTDLPPLVRLVRKGAMACLERRRVVAAHVQRRCRRRRPAPRRACRAAVRRVAADPGR